MGVALVVAAVVVRFSKPEWQSWSQGLALAGLVVTVLYSLSQWRDIARSFGGRNVKYGSIAASERGPDAGDSRRDQLDRVARRINGGT